MNDLKLFQNSEFGEIGILVIDGKEYFPATACAKLLGYSNPQEAIRTHCKGVRKMLTPSSGGSQEVNYIPEGDLYRLIIRSKLPAAERFERWIFDTVLPEIRKTGSYGISDEKELIRALAEKTTAAVMAQLPAIVSETVKLTLDAVSEQGGLPFTKLNDRQEISINFRKYTYPSKLETFPADIIRQVNTMIESMLATQSLNFKKIERFCKANGYSISSVAVRNYFDKMYSVGL